MKFMGKFLLFLVIVVPIVVCVITLNNIWDDDSEDLLYGVDDATEKGSLAQSGENGNDNEVSNTIEEKTYTMGDEEFKSSIGEPTSKIIENATINISVANIYLNPDETSEILDTITKHTIVTTQSFPNGWSRIKSATTASGWVKTENITLPEDAGRVLVGTLVGKTGVVNVSSLNVRASASTAAKIKNTLTENTEVKILETSGDSNWYKVQWNSLEGWVSSKYITIK